MIADFPADGVLPEHDICVVGSGPAGLALALACAAQGQRVIVLESGGERPAPDTAELGRASIADVRRHAPMETASARALGGSSHWWGGRCVPFDPVDFSTRPYAPDAAWPIAFEELAAWAEPAAAFLGCGPAKFRAVSSNWDRLRGASFDRLERWTPRNNLSQVHAESLRTAANLTVFLHATVCGLKLSRSGACVEALEVAANGGRRQVRSPRFVLACGGIETTRLLLATQRDNPTAFGGRDGPLGRYYMGHLSGKIANLVLSDPADVRLHDFVLDQGVYERRRLSLTDDVLNGQQLLNISFWADNPAFHDPQHRNALLSLTWLGLAIPAVGRRLLPEAVRQSHLGPRPRRVWPHVRNVLADPVGAALQVTTVLRERYLKSPRKPGFLLRNRSGRYALHYHAEQAPSATSRITLTDDCDATGLPRASIALEFRQEDASSVVRAHESLDASLRDAGLGSLEFHTTDSSWSRSVLDQASDGIHQLGSTRMAAQGKPGVVDRDCRVQGVDNLYIASSSVFPSSGQANPTYLLVMLALRLAAHLGALDA